MFFKEFSNRLGNILLKNDKKNWLAISTVFFIILWPILLMAGFSYWTTRQDLTNFALSQRQAIAYLAATTLQEKLDRLADLGVSLASRVQFRRLVSKGNWDEAVQILIDVPKDFPFVDRLVLLDFHGTLMADTPPLADVRGKNFSSRDWYRGVSENWRPYVSEVYQRAAEPRYNVIAVAVPIKSLTEGIAGILVLQIKLDSLLQWTSNIEVGPNGFVVIVDKKGRVAAHPKFAPQETIIDYSEAPTVQKLLRGAQGVEVVFNPHERDRQVVAYQPVAKHGWGILVQQPALTALAVRDSSLRRISKVYGFLLLLNSGLACLILATVIRVKQAEEGNARLAAIVEFSDDAIISKTLNGTIETWNKGAEKIYGYSAEEAIGRSISLLVPPGRPEEIPNILQRVSGGKVVEQYETVRVRKDGKALDVSLTVSPGKNAAGQVIRASAIGRDVTERRQAEIIARDARVFAESVVDTVKETLLVLEKDLRIKWANRSFCEVFKKTQKEIVGQSLYELDGGVWDIAGLRTRLEQILSRGAPLNDFDVGANFPGVGQKVLRLNVRHLYHEGNQAEMILLAIEDITSQSRYESELQMKTEELQKQNQLVREANRLKSEFLANMSHELRTPLNAIIGFAQIIQDAYGGPVTSRQHEYLGDILTSARHLLHLINDVLDLSKVESGKMEFSPEPIHLATLISEVRNILQNLAARKRLTIDIEVCLTFEEVMIDPAKLKQLLYNYVSNAIKFSPEGGRILIRALPWDSGYFRVEVEDNGIGIKADQLSKLFVEFQQLDTGMAKSHQGTGLGLALTKKIVEAQGGQVGVQSIHGLGSTFYAVLPRTATQTPPFEADGSSRAIAIADRPTVLIIEDNERDLIWLTKILSQVGYVVDTARTGAGGVTKAHVRAYSAILLDLILPDTVGWDVLRSIRSQGPNQQAPVIVVTLVTEKEIAKAFPVQDYLVKPIHPDALIGSLKSAGLDPHGAKKKVLVVDDDPTTLKLATVALQSGGYEAVCHSNGKSGLTAATQSGFAAVVLDPLTAGMNGFEFLDRFREIDACRDTPVILWTNKDITREESERLKSSAQSIALKDRHGIDGVLRELRHHVSSTAEPPADERPSS